MFRSFLKKEKKNMLCYLSEESIKYFSPKYFLFTTKAHGNGFFQFKNRYIQFISGRQNLINNLNKSSF